MATQLDGKTNERGHRLDTQPVDLRGRSAAERAARNADITALACAQRRERNGVALGWQETESKIIERTYLHACTINDYADLIPDRSTRYEKIKRIRQQGKLRFTGYIQEKSGRPQDVLCNGYFPSKLHHEVELTRLLLFYDVHIERGPDVDAALRPDATLWFPNGEKWHFEYDTGKQTLRQVEQRWKVYLDCPDLVAVITRRKNLDGLLSRAGPYGNCMHLAHYADLLADPYGEHLMDVTGRKFAFERPE